MSTEQNKVNYHLFIEEVMNKGNVDIIDEIASPNLIVHFLPPGTPPGGASLKRHVASLRTAFPDLTITVEDLIAAGNKIVARCTMSGTQRGPFLNHLKTLMPPTGKRFSAQGIDIWLFDGNGKWVELWSTLDRLGMLQQLGAIPAASTSAAVST
jgi:predicted ester cyclase